MKKSFQKQMRDKQHENKLIWTCDFIKHIRKGMNRFKRPENKRWINRLFVLSLRPVPDLSVFNKEFSSTASPEKPFHPIAPRYWAAISVSRFFSYYRRSIKDWTGRKAHNVLTRRWTVGNSFDCLGKVNRHRILRLLPSFVHICLRKSCNWVKLMSC